MNSTSRRLQISLAVALLALGFSRASAASSSPSTHGTEISSSVNTETHFIYPGAGVGGIGDED